MNDELKRCRALADEHCRTLGLDSVPLGWSTRMKTSLANSQRWPVRLINLNRNLWPDADRATQDETVAHEVAHQGSEGMHGPSWRKVMAKLGYPDAKACHDLDLSQVVIRTAYATICTGCGAHGTASHSKTSFRRLRRQGYAKGTRTHEGCGELRWSSFQTMGDGSAGKVEVVS